MSERQKKRRIYSTAAEAATVLPSWPATLLDLFHCWLSLYCLRPLPSLLIVRHASCLLHFEESVHWQVWLRCTDSGLAVSNWVGQVAFASMYTHYETPSLIPDQCISVLQPLEEHKDWQQRAAHFKWTHFLCAIVEPRTIVFKTAGRDVLLTCPQQHGSTRQVFCPPSP